MYLEPWHADIFDFLNCRKNNGSEEKRARDLFFALWIPDLFMERVEADKDWTLMCPHECPGLYRVWGDEFKELYERFVKLHVLFNWAALGFNFRCCPSANEHCHVVGVSNQSVIDESIVMTRYERQGKVRRVIRARKLWHEIITSQIETGVPYMVYKDACNRKSNQQNLGTIVSSNLCTEVVQYSDKDEVS